MPLIAPPRVAATTPIALISISALLPPAALEKDEELEDLEEAVFVTQPETALAVPCDSLSESPASCDPESSRPGPSPALLSIYFLAGVGIARRASPEASQSEL